MTTKERLEQNNNEIAACIELAEQFSGVDVATGLTVGASETATENEGATNGNVHLNLIDKNGVMDSHKIIGAGGTSVTSDENGTITISSTEYTRESLGAAPAGFGLGLTGTEMPVISDVASIAKTGWYRCTSSTDNWVGSSGVIYAVASRDGYITLTGYTENMLSFDYMAILQAVIYRGVLQDWEWVNPPMIPGVEYRTTERWKGKAVYTMMFDFGALPNNSLASITSPITGAKEIVNYYGAATDTTTHSATHTAVADPFVNNHWVNLMNNGTVRIGITTTSDMSKYTAVITMEYTKE